MKYTTLIWHLRRDDPRQLKELLDNSDSEIRISHYLKRMGFEFKGKCEDDAIGTVWVQPEADGYIILDYDFGKLLM